MRSACEAYRPATSAEWDTPLMSFMCNAVKECASLIHEFSTASVGRFVRYSIASRRLGGLPVAFHSPESAAQRGRCSSKSDLTWRSTSAVQRSAAQRSAVQYSGTLSAVLGGICVADRTAAVVNSADGRSSGAAELFDALYCRLFVHAYECLAQLAGDVEDFSAALVMVRPLLCSRCADLHSAGRSARRTQRALPLAANSHGVRLRRRRCCSRFDARFATDCAACTFAPVRTRVRARVVFRGT